MAAKIVLKVGEMLNKRLRCRFFIIFMSDDFRLRDIQPLKNQAVLYVFVYKPD